nr:PTS system mannose/fructose/sorbose family transporter subunit IID [Enterococcus mediterraneensis]
MKNEATKKELLQMNTRWIFTSQICWNYERMMSTGYLYSILPFLEKNYPNKQDLQSMLRMHNQFFNSNPMTGTLILGIDQAIEEKEGIKSKEVVTGIKTGLMGPFAGVGDTLFGVLLPTIMGSIAAYMGLQGNVTGVLLWIAANISVVVLRYFLMLSGYRQGTKLVNEMGNRLQILTDTAILLGMTVVGALIPTVVNAPISFIYKSGEVEMKLQEILDQVMPSLIPVLLVMLVYHLLGKKKMTSSKAILFIMILGIVLYNLHILG